MTAIHRENIPRFLIGLSAMIVSLLLFFQHRPSVLVSIAGCYLLVICLIDTMYSKIPNLCNLALLSAGLIYSVYNFGISGLWHSLLGFSVGFLLLLAPYLLGGIGGGDVKALAAFGALLGPNDVFQVFLYIGLVGGLFAILHFIFQKRLLQKIAGAGRAFMGFLGTRDAQCIRPDTSEKLRFPYAAAFAFGFFFYVNYGDLYSVFETLISSA